MIPLWPMPVDLLKSALELVGLLPGAPPLAGQVQASVEYLLNSLWQGTLIVTLVALALRLYGRTNGATRHTIWCATLAAVLLAPLLSASLAGRNHAQGPAGPQSPAKTTAAVGEVPSLDPDCRAAERREAVHPQGLSMEPRGQTLGMAEHFGESSEQWARLDLGPRVPELPIVLPDPTAWATVQLPEGAWTFALFLLWLGIALLRLIRLADGYLEVRRILAECRPLGHDRSTSLRFWLAASATHRSARLAESDRIPVPALLGFIRPVVVFPAAVAAGLSASELKCIGLHEMAHARRGDQWSNLLQRLVECLFFFHPAVMWVSRRLTLEREIACDDWVVAATGEPRPYAACLARLIESAQRPAYTLPVPGAVFTRPQIIRRVETLLGKRDHCSPRLSRATTFAGVALLGLAVFQIGLVGPLVAVTQAAPPKREAPPAAPSPPAPAAPIPSVPQEALPDPPAPPVASAIDAVPLFPSAPRAASAVRAPRGERAPLAAAETAARDAKRADDDVARGLRAVELSMTDLDRIDFEGSVSVHGDNGELSYSWSDRGHKIRVEMEGDVTFAPDESGVLKISRDGYFRIEERKGDLRHELEILPGRSGELEYYYSEKGRSQPYDDQAKAWLARALPDIMRRTGLNAGQRVERLYGEGGADAVLAETAALESDHVRRLYYEELLELDGGKGPTVRAMLRQMVGRTDSDYETAELLIALAPYATNDPEARDAYLKTARALDSDYETRRVLTAIGTLGDLGPEDARAVLEVADRMDSDYEKAELLIEVADLCRKQPELRRDYLAALRGMDSDYEKRRTLDALGDIPDADDDFVAGVLAMANTIGSDYERAELLTGMADEATRSDALLEAYLNSAEAIDSDYEKRRAIAALTLGDGVGEDALLDLLRIAEGIDSDYEKAEFLLEYGKLYLGATRLENALHDAVETIGSDYERDRVEAQLWRHERRSRSFDR